MMTIQTGQITEEKTHATMLRNMCGARVFGRLAAAASLFHVRRVWAFARC